MQNRAVPRQAPSGFLFAEPGGGRHEARHPLVPVRRGGLRRRRRHGRLAAKGSIDHLAGVSWPLVAVLAGLIAFWQLAPVGRLREGRLTSTTSLDATFALALVATAPPALALLAVAVPSAIDSVKDRSAWYKTLFNVGQYSLSIAAARAVFCAISGNGFFSSSPTQGNHLLAIVAMGVTYFSVNELLVQPAVALATRENLRAVFTAVVREPPSTGSSKYLRRCWRWRPSRRSVRWRCWRCSPR